MDSENTPLVPEREAAKVEQTADQVLAVAGDFAIATAEQYEDAARLLQNIKGQINAAEEKRLSLTRPLDAAKKGIMDLFRGPIAKFRDAERAIKGAIAAWDREQERIRREAQRKADEAARKERERLAKLEAAAKKRGDEQKAEQFASRQESVVAPVVTTPKPEVSGISKRKVWKFQIEDASKLPRAYLVPDEKKIGGVVRTLGGDAEIPGVRVYAEEVIAARAAG